MYVHLLVDMKVILRNARYNGEDNMKRENQQDATIRCLLLTSISTCFGHPYSHLQENKEPVIAFGELFWFCWMWLVAVVGRCLEGSEHYSIVSKVRREKTIKMQQLDVYY